MSILCMSTFGAGCLAAYPLVGLMALDAAVTMQLYKDKFTIISDGVFQDNITETEKMRKQEKINFTGKEFQIINEDSQYT